MDSCPIYHLGQHPFPVVARTTSSFLLLLLPTGDRNQQQYWKSLPHLKVSNGVVCCRSVATWVHSFQVFHPWCQPERHRFTSRYRTVLSISSPYLCRNRISFDTPGAFHFQLYCHLVVLQGPSLEQKDWQITPFDTIHGSFSGKCVSAGLQSPFIHHRLDASDFPIVFL